MQELRTCRKTLIPAHERDCIELGAAAHLSGGISAGVVRATTSCRAKHRSVLLRATQNLSPMLSGRRSYSASNLFQLLIAFDTSWTDIPFMWFIINDSGAFV